MTSVGVMASAVHIGTGELFEPFNNFTDNGWVLTGPPTIVAGRTGTAAQTTGSTARADYNIPTALQSDWLTVGCALRWNGSAANIFRFHSDAGVTVHNTVQVLAAGSISYTRSASTQASSAAGVVVAGTWQYIEVQARLGDSPNGVATVRVNGTPVITATGFDSKNAGTKTVYDQLRIGAVVSGATTEYDDLYLTMGAGAVFKGDITIP